MEQSQSLAEFDHLNVEPGMVHGLALNARYLAYTTIQDDDEADTIIHIVEIGEQSLSGTPRRDCANGHTGFIGFLLFSPFDQSLLFSASEDRRVGVWRVDAEHEAAPLHVILSNHQSAVRFLDVCAPRRLLASTGDDATRFWSLDSLDCVGVIEHNVTCEVFVGRFASVHTSWFVTGDAKGRVRLFDYDSNQTLAVVSHEPDGDDDEDEHVETNINDLRFCSDDATLIVAGEGLGQPFLLYTVSSDGGELSRDHIGHVVDVSDEPTRCVALTRRRTARSERFLIGDEQGRIVAFEMTDHQYYQPIEWHKRHEDCIYTFATSCDNDMIGTASWDERICLFFDGQLTRDIADFFRACQNTFLLLRAYAQTSPLHVMQRVAEYLAPAELLSDAERTRLMTAARVRASVRAARAIIAPQNYHRRMRWLLTLVYVTADAHY